MLVLPHSLLCYTKIIIETKERTKVKRILLNGLHYEPNGAGISRYTHKLIETFIKEDYPLDILIRGEFVDNYKATNVIGVDKIMTSSTKRIIEEQWEQRKLYKNYDLIHFPDYATPILYSGSKVATIHDMAMHTMKDKYTPMQNITKKTLLEHTVRRAEHLICDSEFAKKELLRYYPKVKAEVSVISLGVEAPQVEVKEEVCQEVLKKFKITSKYILFVGTLAPHKNIENLIRSFADIKKEHEEYQLVVAGKKGWMYEEIFNSVKELGLEKGVVFTGFTSEMELEVLYQCAEFLACISLYEGFGLPPLEAMMRKCPVLVSHLEIFEETCHDSALYCDPLDIKDITRQMLTLIKETALKEKLKVLGQERVKRFAWNKVAQATFNVYEQVLSKSIKSNYKISYGHTDINQ